MSLQNVKLYDVNEGLDYRNGGPYLDRELRRKAEDNRALIEGRAPDYDPAIYGPETRLVTAKDLVEHVGILKHPVLVWQVAVNDLEDRDIISTVSVDVLPVQIDITADDDLEV